MLLIKRLLGPVRVVLNGGRREQVQLQVAAREERGRCSRERVRQRDLHLELPLTVLTSVIDLGEFSLQSHRGCHLDNLEAFRVGDVLLGHDLLEAGFRLGEEPVAQFGVLNQVAIPRFRERLECFLDALQVCIGVGAELGVENRRDDFVGDPKILLRYLLEQEDGLRHRGQPGGVGIGIIQNPGDLVALRQMNALEFFLEDVINPVKSDEMPDGQGTQEQMVWLAEEGTDNDQDRTLLGPDDAARGSRVPQSAQNILDQDDVVRKERIIPFQDSRIGVREAVVRIYQPRAYACGRAELRPMIGDRFAECRDPFGRVGLSEKPLRHDEVDVVRAESELLWEAICEDTDTRPGLVESAVDVLRELPGQSQSKRPSRARST